ncbi:transposase [Anaerococcus sp. AGMB00486]|uniref:Transposase n=1 Tax=Anaerococcus faecalis TaxID=2742993 RepID=A0ABX2NBP2_9FIRM|nr:transposase [Anaerococcus faecalis]NVF12142.1 transposase [Anaerococcus faecalis]
MPRLARSIQNYNYFHIMTKGINKENIFYSDFYKNQIIRYYFDEKYDWDILAYAIMDNHTHFLVRVDNTEILSNIMKSINIRYSILYNNIEDRNGHLFQNRFKSSPIKSERQLFECTRYIHNNPVFAYIAKSPKDYKFSSYNDFFIENKDNISKCFIRLIKDNFKNENEFLKFHCERIFSLQLDTKEDTSIVKKYIMDKLENKLDSNEKIKLSKKLREMGFTKVEISKKLKISRNRI